MFFCPAGSGMACMGVTFTTIIIICHPWHHSHHYYYHNHHPYIKITMVWTWTAVDCLGVLRPPSMTLSRLLELLPGCRQYFTFRSWNQLLPQTIDCNKKYSRKHKIWVDLDWLDLCTIVHEYQTMLPTYPPHLKAKREREKSESGKKLTKWIPTLPPPTDSRSACKKEQLKAFFV